MGSFTVDFRFPLDDVAAAKLRQFARDPESVSQPPDTLTFGELTIRIDGNIAHPPWSAGKALAFTDTEWISSVVAQLCRAALVLRADGASAKVMFQDDPLEIILTRRHDDVQVAFRAVGKQGGELIAETRVPLEEFVQEVHSTTRRFAESLEKLDPRLPTRPPFDECARLLRDSEA